MNVAVAERVCHIREEMAGRIGESRYRTWFGGSTELSLNGNRLDVTVENPFVGQWITSNFKDHLLEAARTVLGGEPQVHVRVADKPAGDAAVRPGPLPVKPAARTAGPRPLGPQPTRGPGVLRGELDTFVVGPSNELAHSAARGLVRNPGEGLRLLVLHGGCGLGKTHLLQGICNGVRREHPALEWRYLSGEEFTNEFVYAVKTGRIDLFRARFRKVDLLVIDDIHFLANKKATQGEFLHTFNAVDACGKAIVLSSDRHPRSIATLSEPLINRLIAGMVMQIDPPDFSMRREILSRRALAMRAALPGEVLDFVARRVTRNVRELEGALYKLVALASLAKERIDLEVARLAVEDYLDPTTRSVEVTDIERVVANYFAVSREAIHSKARDRTTSLARGLVMYLIRKHTHMSFPEIGRLLGNKNHSTVLMAARRIEQTAERDGAVTWRTSSGLKEVPLRDVLAAIERDLVQGQSGPA